jgi:membrane fusion protein, multidrug efflux system
MRYVVAIGMVLALAAGLIFVKFKQISSLIHMGEEMAKAGPPPEVVASGVAKEESWEGSLTAVGSVAAAKGVSVSSEIQGVVAVIRFTSGAIVKQGEVLVELDSKVERAQLASIMARRDLASVNADRSRALVASNAIPQAQLDTDVAQLKTSTADLGALQALVERKVIRAPFGGRLGIRGVNVGQFIGPGTVVAVLESMDSVYVDFSIPQQRASDVKVGTKVAVAVAGAQNAKDLVVEGQVAAIEPNVDAVTRTMKLRVSVLNKDDKLRAGMFAKVTVDLPNHGGATVIVPATAVVHASYGDSVFIIEEKKDGGTGKLARQQFVRMGESRGDFVSLLDGVKAGQELVVAGAFKLHNGAGVVINNDVKTDPQQLPRLENR